MPNTTTYDQQVKINRLTNVAAQWSMGEPCRPEYANFYSNREWPTCHCSTLNMFPVAQHYNGQGYHDYQGWQRYSFNRRQEFHNMQVNYQESFTNHHQITLITQLFSMIFKVIPQGRCWHKCH